MRTKLPKVERGRPVKNDKGDWVQVTMVLKKTTVAKLREGAGSKHFGAFVQEHLERHPVPSQEEYARMQLWARASVEMKDIAKKAARREARAGNRIREAA